jgi:hypothetical protein
MDFCHFARTDSVPQDRNNDTQKNAGASGEPLQLRKGFDDFTCVEASGDSAAVVCGVAAV